MFWNDFKFALRHLSRRKGYHLVNIGGLAVGMACALLIALWVADESSYDAFHPEADRLYRLNWDFKWNGNEGLGPGTPPPLARVLATEVSGVETATRLFALADQVVRHGDRMFNESDVVAADSNFFDVFGFKLAAGDPETALRAANSVILTQETARKYFGSDDPMGKTLLIGEDQGRYRSTFVVTGVLQPLPGNTHIKADLFTSMDSHPVVRNFDWSWVWMQVATYARLESSADPTVVESNIQKAARNHIPASFAQLGFSYDGLEAGNERWDFVLHSIREVYSDGYQTGNRVGPTGNGTYVYIFATVAVFLVLIACINFTNLSTAQAATRAKEIGIRKVLGSSHGGLMRQFLAESLLFSALAMPLALLLVEALLGPFNQLTGKALEFDLFAPVWFPLALAGLAVLVGLLAGGYPSYYLATFQPIKSLKGDVPKSGGRWNLRNALVVFQFAVTIVLISCTFAVQKQIGYLRKANLGFDQENVLVVSNQNSRLGLQAETFRDKLLGHGGIREATLTTGVPGYGTYNDYYTIEGKGDERVLLSSYMADEHFVKTLGLEVVAGQGFSPEFSANAGSVLVNEAAVAYFGWGNEAVGKTIQYHGGRTFTVAGVLKDFHFMDLRAPVLPFVLFHRSAEAYNIVDSHVAVRVGAGHVEDVLAFIRSEWEKTAPDAPLDYRFLDETLDRQYRAEQRFGSVFLAFSLITVTVACIGLLGLVSFATEQRTKEIGVRKVLGASVPDIIGLLSKDFFRLVIVANLLAWPVAWYAMSRWLESFAFRTSLDVWIFLLAGLVTVTVAALTTGWRAVKAALANPVDSLRNE